MEKAYKYRIYPTKYQKELIQKTFGCVRFIYNHFLYDQMEMYQTDKAHMSYYDMSKVLTGLKQENDWLKEPDKCALQNTLKDLNASYQNYFREMKKPSYIRYSKEKLEHLARIGKSPTLYDSNGHPKFKKKKDHYHSYRTNCSDNNIDFLDRKIKLPKLGWLKTKDKMIPQGRILNATVSQEPSGNYYVSICCTDVDIKPLPKTNKMIGLDLGIKDFCVDSNGIHYPNPKYLSKSMHKLKRLQRELDRKTKFGSNWEKSRIRLARQYEKITNQKTDYLQKLSTELIRKNDVIKIEDLDIQEMIGKSQGLTNKEKANFRKEISEVSWYEFTRQLEYKARWYGKTLMKVDKYYASSQLCHVCGYKNPRVKDLSVRKWKCPECGTTHDRDENAAINILNY